MFILPGGLLDIYQLIKMIDPTEMDRNKYYTKNKLVPIPFREWGEGGARGRTWCRANSVLAESILISHNYLS